MGRALFPATSLVIALCGIVPFTGFSGDGVFDLLFFGLAPGFVTAGLLFRGWASSLQRFWASVVFSPVTLAALLLLTIWGGGFSIPGIAPWLRGALIAGLLLVAMIPGPLRPAGRPESLPLRWLALFGAFAVLILLSYTLPANRLSVHGIFHGAHIGQLLNGLVPPDNPAFAGEPARNYWAYHLLYAFMTDRTGLPYYTVSAIYQTTCFVLYGLGIWYFVRRAGAVGAGGGIVVAFLCAFGLNLEGPLFLLYEIAAHGGDASWWRLGKILGGLGGPWLQPNVHAGIFVKFLSFNGFIFGLIYFAAMAVFALERRYLAAAVALLGMVLLHPQTAMFAATVFGLALLWRELGEGRPDAGPVPSLAGGILAMIQDGRALRLAATIILPFVVATPYILTFMGSGEGGSLFRIRPNAFAAINWPLLYLLPLPFALYGAVITARRTGPADRFLTAGAAAAVFMALFFDMPYLTQYKFLYLSCPFVWLLAFRGLSVLRHGAVLRRLPLAFVGLSVVNTGAIVLAWWLLPSWFGHRVPYQEAGFVQLSTARAESALLRRAAATLPARAVIVENAGYCEKSLIGAVTGRRSYYTPCYYFTGIYPQRQERERLLAEVFDAKHPAVARLAEIAGALDAPVYLLVSRRQLGDAFVPVMAAARSAGSLLRPVIVQDGEAGLFALTRQEPSTSR